jgi:hypothetical protein
MVMAHLKTLVAAMAIAGLGTGFALAADVGTFPTTDGVNYGPPAGVMPGISGNLQLFGGMRDESECGDCDFSILGGSGKATLWLTDMLSAQIDGNFDSWHWDDDESWNVGSIIGHLSYRNPGHLIGLYGGVVDADWHNRLYTIGIEGQAYFGPLTAEGRVGYVTEDSGGDNDTITHVRGALRYFPADNAKLEVNAEYQDYSWGDSSTAVGALAEYQFGMRPYSVFAAVDHLEYNDSSSSDWNATTGWVGFKVLFNQNYLRTEDQTGSSLGDGINLSIRHAD